MGGFGSGRWGLHRKAATVEACRSIDIAAAVRTAPPRAGVSGTFTWARGGATAATVGFSYAESSGVFTLGLRYHWTPPVPTASGRDVDLAVRLERTPVPRGGWRWWARCPLAAGGVACRRRVGKLYLSPGSALFGCRACHRLAYASSQEHDARVDRLIRDDAARERVCRDPGGASASTLGLLLKALAAEQRRDARTFIRSEKRPARKPPKPRAPE